MNLLELTQTVARFSGTVDPRSITTAANSRGRIRTIVEFVREAWLEIQNSEQSWRFLTRALPESTTLQAGIEAVTPESLIPSEAHLWANWLLGTGGSRVVPLSVWPAPPPTETPESPEARIARRSKERNLVVRTWTGGSNPFREFQTGSQAASPRDGQPQYVAIDPQDRLTFWPVPEQAYRLAGTYRRLPQELDADDAEPDLILPNHHMVIVRAAILKLYRHDEAPPQALFNAEQDLLVPMRALRRRYLYGSRVGPAPAAIGPTGASVDIININNNIDFTLRNSVRQG